MYSSNWKVFLSFLIFLLWLRTDRVLPSGTQSEMIGRFIYFKYLVLTLLHALCKGFRDCFCLVWFDVDMAINYLKYLASKFYLFCLFILSYANISICFMYHFLIHTFNIDPSMLFNQDISRKYTASLRRNCNIYRSKPFSIP